jgi:hypothetical protein
MRIIPMQYSHLLLSFLLNLDILFSTILVYKLFYLHQDALLWTNIEFGYSVLRFLFSMVADALLHTGTLTSNGVEILVLVLTWWLFYKHLQRVLAQKK